MIMIFGGKKKINNVDDFLKKIDNFAKKNNAIIQVFNADMIFGKKHIISAYQHAKRAIKNKTNTTNSIEKELLLYSSGDRQLKNAIPKMGVKKGDSNIVFLVDCNNKEIKNKIVKQFEIIKDDKILKGDINTIKKFGISEAEIKTVNKNNYQGLILEKIALLDIIK